MTVTDLHDKAMALASEATLASSHGDDADARSLFAQSLEYERRAADALFSQRAAEPTRSVLYRSAASLALSCGEYRDAEKLAATGLSGEPPEIIAEELRQVLGDAIFLGGVKFRGLRLQPDEVQMSLAGELVGHGRAAADILVDRVEVLGKLVSRTVERLKDLPYREAGRTPRDLREKYCLFLNAVDSGSIALTVQLGQSEQLVVPGLEEGGGIVAELLGCLKAFSDSDEPELHRRIGNDAYFRNFVGLARRLSPDGKNVTRVTFTSSVLDEPLVLKRRITLEDRTGLGSEQVKRVRGWLRYADAIQADKAFIRIIDDEGVEHRFKVPEGLMSDIVKPLWDTFVEARGAVSGRTTWLSGVEPAEEKTASGSTSPVQTS